MASSSRAPPPLPLNIAASPRGPSDSQSGSDYFGSPSSIQERRTGSYSSDSSGPESPSTPLRRPTGWVRPAPTVNVHTTCGRHTDQMLFGGPSLSELARSVWRKN